MNVADIRANIEQATVQLTNLRDSILTKEVFIEELIRINEMIVVLVSFSALDDRHLHDQLVNIDRVTSAIANYISFMNTAFNGI